MTELPVPPSHDLPRSEHPVFWGYGDLALFFGFALPCLLAAAFAVRGFVAMLGLDVHRKILEMLPAQFLGYGILFFLLFLLFRFQYGRPLWSSLGWVPSSHPLGRTAAAGVVLALIVALLGVAMRTPDINTPMKELLSDRTSILVVAIFGVTLGPFFEEMAFRGFMQPLFVRSLGVVPGIILAAVPFGVLHLAQYAFSWRHGILITFAGAAFGWMRHRTGSTFASTLMHSAYNAVFFVALAFQGKELPRSW